MTAISVMAAIGGLVALTSENIVDKRVNFSHFVFVIKLDIHRWRFQQLSRLGKLTQVPHHRIALVGDAEAEL